MLQPTHYMIQYKLPGSPLFTNIDFAVHGQIMTAYDQFASLGLKKFKKLKFRLQPKVRGADMFRVDKPKTVKVRLDNRNSING